MVDNPIRSQSGQASASADPVTAGVMAVMEAVK